MSSADRIRKYRRLASYRQGGKCFWCGIRMIYPHHWDYADKPFQRVTADHIIPRCRGGANSQDNIVAACSGCNAIRGNLEISLWVPILIVVRIPLFQFAAGRGN